MINVNSRAVIDHLVFGCDHLQYGTSYLEQRLGVGFSGGGKHTLMATHNRLLKLQDSIYFEAIAIDHKAVQKHGNIHRKRWFSLDEDRTNKYCNTMLIKEKIINEYVLLKLKLKIEFAR